MNANSHLEPYNPPQPPEELFTNLGWTKRGSVWFKKNGDVVFFIDVLNAYPPLMAWVKARTGAP
jgi:hypothetical protein